MKIRHLLRSLRARMRSLEDHAVRHALMRAVPRSALNRLYNLCPDRFKERIFWRFGGIYVGRTGDGPTSTWRVDFGKREILQPLDASSMRLDWANALGLLGHDLPVKLTYKNLLSSPEKPDVFVDIGANYGTHSLVFLANDVRTISVEPNSKCHGYFARLCEFNKLTGGTLEKCALGAEAGEVILSYPEDETWLGTVNRTVRDDLESRRPVEHETVRLATLDEILTQNSGDRILIKIDVEGNELEVLKGAEQTLRQARPLIVFESFRDDSRSRLFLFFREHGYAVSRLPWGPDLPKQALDLASFDASPATNFIAYPGAARPLS